MSISRRQFLLGTAAGLVLPSFYERALSYFENHGEPMLITPKRPTEVLYACSEFTEEGFQLNLGNPHDVYPPEMTIREFCITYGEGDPEKWWREFWLYTDDCEPVDLDAKMDQASVEEWWILKKSPFARAYHYLEGIDLGPQLNGADVAGGLDFYCGGGPGNSFFAVDAVDDVSLSLLQQRLNEIRSGIIVEIM